MPARIRCMAELVHIISAEIQILDIIETDRVLKCRDQAAESGGKDW